MHAPRCLVLFGLASALAWASAPTAEKPTTRPVGKTAAKEVETEDPNHWSYTGARTGPANWARMKPEFATCGEGREQSPVNIVNAKPQPMSPLKISYGMSKLSLVNNGHTIQVNVEPGSWLEAFEERFELKQFHFHTPAEEQVNGKRYPLVAHMVHRSESGKLAVMAVLFEVGASHPLLDTLWARMPEEHGETRSFDERVISPAALLPPNLRFYTLMGSLTTPPCSEGVRWIILKTPVTLSTAQLARFRQEFPMNARPIQPINDRMIFEGP